jgi:hypothetical protein
MANNRKINAAANKAVSRCLISLESIFFMGL